MEEAALTPPCHCHRWALASLPAAGPESRDLLLLRLLLAR